MLLKTIIAFTIAHSITLAICDAGVRQRPGGPAECGDRAEHSLSRIRDRAQLASRDQLHDSASMGCGDRLWPAAGFGFADALTSAGLPRDELPVALLSFNVGVELGQMGFVALVI